MPELVHGRASTYNNYKCRCTPCRKAWADYIREGGYVRRYQEKKRQEKQAAKEKLTQSQDSANILGSTYQQMKTLDLNDPNVEQQFLNQLRETGI